MIDGDVYMVKSKKSYWKHSIECKDHKNNKYSSMTEMAKAYGLTQECLSRRLKVYQWDLERALTTPTKNSPNVFMITVGIGFVL